VPVLLAQPAAATSWIRDRSEASVGGFLAGLGGSLRVLPNFGNALPAPLFWLAAVLGLAWLALLLRFSRRADSESRLGLCAVLGTLGTILLVSLWRPIAVAGRSEIVILPIWLWLAALAGEESRAARLAAAATAAIAAVSCLVLLVTPRPAPFAEVPGQLEASARSDDLIIATANFYLPAVLARDRGLLAGELRAVPEDLADHPGWFRSVIGDPEFRLLEKDLARAGDRTAHLLVDSAYWGPRLRRLLESRGPFRSSPAPRAGLWIVSSGRAFPAN
jgi:hypothetical protein